MRTAFAQQLTDIATRIDAGLRDAAQSLAEFAASVGTPSLDQADALAGTGRRQRRLTRELDLDLVTITARQAPVAGDLRLTVAMIEIVHHQALVANQFCLIAEQLGEIAGSSADGRSTAAQLAAMARLAAGQLHGAAGAFSGRDGAVAARLEVDDDALDRLNREVFVAAQGLEVLPERRELALRHVLIARSLERIGDNAVSIAWQAAFIVTAEFPGRAA